MINIKIFYFLFLLLIILIFFLINIIEKKNQQIIELINKYNLEDNEQIKKKIELFYLKELDNIKNININYSNSLNFLLQIKHNIQIVLEKLKNLDNFDKNFLSNNIIKQKFVLHISRHDGTKNDFISVAEALNIRGHLMNIIYPQSGLNADYHISKELSNLIWNAYSEVYSFFDAIIISDTTATIRIFVENDKKYTKPIIVLISNRFDIGHGGDLEFIEIFKKAINT